MEQPLPCSPRKQLRWLEAATDSSGAKDASLHPSFGLPISLSLSPCAPGPSSLLSLLARRLSRAGGCGDRHCHVPVPGLVPEQWGSGLPASLEASLHQQTEDLLHLSLCP